LGSVELSAEFRDASLPGYELGWRGNESRGAFGIGSCRIVARKYLRCEKTACVIWRDSETVKIPLPETTGEEWES
jgi:hypothetical protein